MTDASDRKASDEPLMRIGEVARLIGVTKYTIGVWARAGRIPSKQLVGSRRFVRREIDEWIRNGGVSSEAHDPGEAK